MKTETIEEFLARGGKVEVVPTKPTSFKQIMKVKSRGEIITLDEGDETYGQKNKTSRVERPVQMRRVDVSKVPSDLLAQLKALNVDI
jgi:carbamoylphosphate synthase small subunit